ncbi:hypothetical protein LXA43DRAFT_1059934 [Ganoderma leucocontextum]|nr:hypothetical protein LXA43DRAFT_1059934 [Ganoderma leucocontextum]
MPDNSGLAPSLQPTTHDESKFENVEMMPPQSTARGRGSASSKVVVTPSKHIITLKGLWVDVLNNWQKTLKQIRKKACTTCNPADPTDPGRRLGCNQSDEGTWKCSHCYRNELPCSWAIDASKLGLGYEPPLQAKRAAQGFFVAQLVAMQRLLHHPKRDPRRHSVQWTLQHHPRQEALHWREGDFKIDNVLEEVEKLNETVRKVKSHVQTLAHTDANVKLLVNKVTDLNDGVKNLLTKLKDQVSDLGGQLEEQRRVAHRNVVVNNQRCLTLGDRSESLMKSTSAFLDAWKSQPSRTPPAVVHNLHPDSARWLGQQGHPTMHVAEVVLDKRSRYESKYYHIEYNDDHGWKLFLSDPVTALELYRSTTFVNTYHVVNFLVLRGASFRTLLLLSRRDEDSFNYQEPTSPRHVNRWVTQLWIDQTGPDKFQCYRVRVKWFLESPRRARAAVMTGGILWRIAMEFVAPDVFQLVMSGPLR